MQIRPLKSEEILPALRLAATTYHVCLEPTEKDPQMSEYFYRYLDPENLQEMAKNGRIYFWGAIQEKELIGVAALTNDGRITMCYVHPDHQERGIGTAMLEAIRQYAPELYLNRISVNAAPAWTASWFRRQGFEEIGRTSADAPYKAMDLKLDRVIDYPKRSISDKTTILLVSGTLLLCTVTAVAMALSRLL